MAEKSDIQSIVKNRRATFDYEIERRIEGGLVLVGSEVKSLRAGKVDLSDAYAQVEKGEAFLRQMYIAPFEQAKVFPHEVRRPRKILLHAREIEDIQKDVMRGGYTVVPIELYFKKGRIKVLLGVGKGKKTVDKRRAIAKKDVERETRSAERRGARE